MVAFGNLGVQGGRLIVNGFLFDAKNPQYPQVLAKQYNEDASEDSARQIAHRFADEIIFRLGGGITGIAETKIYYVKIRPAATKRSGRWTTTAPTSTPHPPRHRLHLAAHLARQLPPRLLLARQRRLPDRMFSLLLEPHGQLPGSRRHQPLACMGAQRQASIAFSSSRTGDPEIWISDANGSLARRITSFRGPDVSPILNPKTGAQIAWISGRTGLPQLYIMDTDGSGVQRMTDGGYATSPSWSPNGQFLAFAWDRKYGPGAPGGQDIYVMEIATKTLDSAHPRRRPLRLPLLVARRPPHRLRQLFRRQSRAHEAS